MGKREDTKHMPVRGLYMWGGVGGKTWLMDLSRRERSQRLTFFWVLKSEPPVQGRPDPLEIIADRFKAETDALFW